MTHPYPAHSPQQSPWERYRATERDARIVYLIAVRDAHQRYLEGPYPDRDSYETAELHAWVTNYQLCRQAWHQYQADMESPPPPPARSPEHSRPAGRPADEPTGPATNPLDLKYNQFRSANVTPVPFPGPASADSTPSYRPGGYLPDRDGPSPAWPRPYVGEGGGT